MRRRARPGFPELWAVAAVALGVWLTRTDYVLFPQSRGLGVGGVGSYPRYAGVVADNAPGGLLPAWVIVVLMVGLGLVIVLGVTVVITRWPRGRNEGNEVRQDPDDAAPAPDDNSAASPGVEAVPNGEEIVRAWRAVEVALEEARHPLETSRTSRSVLRAAVEAGASRGVALELADIYDQCRYSGLATADADRARAAALSEQICAVMGR